MATKIDDLFEIMAATLEYFISRNPGNMIAIVYREEFDDLHQRYEQFSAKHPRDWTEAERAMAKEIVGEIRAVVATLEKIDDLKD